MADRATVNKTVQIGVETTEGTAVPANKLLTALSIEPGIQADVNSFRPAGQKFLSLAAENREWTEARLGGVPTYTEIIYPLSSVLTGVAPVAGPAGTPQPQTWTFTPSNAGPDAPKTFTIEAGDSVRAEKFSNGLVTDFGITIARDAMSLSGTMIGTSITDGITMAASPTAIALVPILPSQVDIFLDTSSANIGTTKLLRALRAEWRIANRYNPIWPLNSAKASFDGHVEAVPTCTLALTMERDAVGMANLGYLRNGSRVFIRIKATGGLISGTTNYSLQIDMCGSVTDPGNVSDADGLDAQDFTFSAVYDATWGKALQVAVVNSLTAL